MLNHLPQVSDHKKFIFLSICYLLVVIGILTNFENKRLWGDEGHYLEMAHMQEAIGGILPRVLPGTLTYDWWPSFAYGFYSLFAKDEIREILKSEKKNKLRKHNGLQAEFVSRIAHINSILLFITGLSIYILSLKSGLNESYSAIAASLVLLNPRVLFYLQALWPEVLHLTLLCSATLLYIISLDKGHKLALLSSSVLFGFCALTKGVVAIYFVLLIGLLIVFLYRRTKLSNLSTFLLIFIIPHYTIIHVQQFKNYLSHDHYSVSANTWINIEAGLIKNYHVKKEGYNSVFERYRKSGSNLKEREANSRKRVLEFICSQPFLDMVNNQLSNYVGQLNQSFFDKGLRENRWVNTKKLRVFGPLCVLMSWFVFILGVVGLLRYSLMNFASITIGLFLVYYLSALAVVGFNARFFIQAIPFLSIFACFALTKPKNQTPSGVDR